MRRARFKNTMYSHRVTEGAQRTFALIGLVGQSEAMRRIFEFVEKVAPTDANVLITGESGVGKEGIARALHLLSGRKGKIFLPINCSAITHALVESQLFGHVKGAFTGASRTQLGLLQQAGEGTMFLDEIGDLPLSLQPKLLRVIEQKEVTPLGSTRAERIDVRIVAATNHDLERELLRNHFREDLYHRLNVIHIQVPPLRDRPDDIPLLSNFFIRRNNTIMKKTFSGIAADGMRLLQRRVWRGNVRELENVIQRAMIFGEGEWIRVSDLEEARVQSLSPYNGKLADAVKEFERSHVEKVLYRVQGDKVMAARILGLSRATFYRKLKYLKANDKT